jgi:hypothetical protein
MFEWIAFESVYVMQRFIKIYKLIRLIPFIGAQSILYQLYYNGFKVDSLDRDPLYWISLGMYLLFIPTIFAILIIILKMCGRPKSAHPLGDQMSERYFNLLETSRNVTMLVIACFIILLLVYYELYIEGVQDIKIRGSFNLLPIASIVFTGLFASLALLICCTKKYLR